MCYAHYRRMQTHGTLELLKFNGTESFAERLKQRSRVVGNCVEYTGSVDTHGYGQLHVKGVMHLAHRVAWEVYVGAIPDGMQVLHKCDNRKCIKRKHLFLGTNADNVADKMRKGREARGPRRKRSSTC